MIAAAVLFCLLVLFYIVLSRRAAKIERALSNLDEDILSARTTFIGLDPLGRTGRRLDRAIAKLADERAQLIASEGRLKVALQGCDIGIWDWHLDDGQVYYSSRWKTLLGYAEDEEPGHAESWLKRVHPDDLAVVTALIDAHLSGRSDLFLCEHRLRHKNGEYLWVQQSGVANRHTDGRPARMVGAMADISRRKSAEADLLQSREAYRSLVDGVTQIIFRVDGDGRLVFLNPAWQELTGHPTEEALGLTLASFVHGDERAAVCRLFQGLGGGDARDIACELRLRCRDGAWRWFSLHLRVSDSAQIPLTAGVLSDISAQKVSEMALLRSNRERDAILTLGPDAFVFADEGGVVSFVNPAFVAISGLAAGEVVGKQLSELDRRLSWLSGSSPGISAAGEDADGWLQLERPQKKVIRWLARLLRDGSGGILGRVLYLRDVTRESEVDRMKSDFLSTAAHELRTPMASIFGFSELLLSREFEPAVQRDLLERIHRQTQNLINMVNELLDLSRIEARGGKSFKMAVQDVTPIVLNALAAQYVPEETHKLELDWPKISPKVNIDGEKFLQCLINVLGNAFKYSPAGGLVRLAATHRGENFNAWFGIVVSDTGIGMTAEQCARIFDRFYRADPSGAIPGSGLGMSLVKEYMNIFGGEVEAHSVFGLGTTVVLWLPVARELGDVRGSAA